MEDLRQTGVEGLAQRLRDLAGTADRRVLVGLAGPPGAGKSTLATALARTLGPRAVVVGMDGFHLAQAELERLGRAGRKGAPDTFDRAGYVALLRRLRDPAERDTTVYAPAFDRALEEPVAGAVAIGPAADVVLTEGNYLLAWDEVADLLDLRWSVELADDERRARLHARHVTHGRAPAAATAWMAATDEPNATLVATFRARADALVTLPREFPDVQDGRDPEA